MTHVVHNKIHASRSVLDFFGNRMARIGRIKKTGIIKIIFLYPAYPGHPVPKNWINTVLANLLLRKVRI